MLIALTGGARSGKSTAAIAMATSSDGPVTFIATAEAGDAEMAERIERHRAERPAAWTTIEAPVDLVGAAGNVGAGEIVVIDCLSMWAANRMLEGANADESVDAARASEITAETRELVACLRGRADR